MIKYYYPIVDAMMYLASVVNEESAKALVADLEAAILQPQRQALRLFCLPTSRSVSQKPPDLTMFLHYAII